MVEHHVLHLVQMITPLEPNLVMVTNHAILWDLMVQTVEMLKLSLIPAEALRLAKVLTTTIGKISPLQVALETMCAKHSTEVVCFERSDPTKVIEKRKRTIYLNNGKQETTTKYTKKNKKNYIVTERKKESTIRDIYVCMLLNFM